MKTNHPVGLLDAKKGKTFWDRRCYLPKCGRLLPPKNVIYCWMMMVMMRRMQRRMTGTDN
jgi:hypothetical protein